MGMSEWLLTKGLRWVGRKFDGYKTKIGAFGLILTGIVSAINLIWPNTVPGIPEMTIDQIITSITGGFIALGIGGKIDKNTAAVQAAAPVTIAGVENAPSRQSQPETGRSDGDEQRIVTPELTDEERERLTSGG